MTSATRPARGRTGRHLTRPIGVGDAGWTGVDTERAVPRTVPQRLNAYWRAFALRLGVIQTEIILALVYVLVFGVVSLALRVLGRDLLGKRTPKPSYWVPHERQPVTLERYRRQF